MLLVVACTAVPWLVGSVTRWVKRGPDRPVEEAERLGLVTVTAGLLASNVQVAGAPTWAAHTGVVLWLAWSRWRGSSAPGSWVLAWAFYLSPVFPHKLSHFWCMCLSAWLWWHVARAGLLPRGRAGLAGGLVPAWGALTAAWALSVTLSPCPPLGVERLWRWLPALLVLAPLVWTVGGASGARSLLLRRWGGAGALATLVLVGEHTFGTHSWGEGQFALPHVHSNALAVWLVLSAAALLASWRHRGGAAPLVYFCVCAVGVVLTGSKAGAAGIWLLLLAATTAVNRRSLRWAARGILVLGAVAFLPMVIRQYPRSIEDRGLLLQSAARAFLERPLLGWGLGNLHVHLRYAWERIWNAGVLDWHTHNLYLQVAESSGLLGLGSLLAVLVVAFRSAKGWNRLPVALLGILGFVDYVLQWSGIMPAFVLSLGVAGRRLERPRRGVVLGMLAAAVVVFGGAWGPATRHRCESDPVQRLEEARDLWEDGHVSESLEAYLEAALLDPAEEWAVGVWEEGALRSLRGGDRQQGAAMFGRALLVRPQLAMRDYWPRLAAGGPRSRLTLSEAFAWAEWEARLLSKRNPVGGVMLLGNLTRSYYLAGRRDDARRVFDEIRHLPPLSTGPDDSQWTLDAWMDAWIEKQQELTGRHRF